jgi:hypothetical protein
MNTKYVDDISPPSSIPYALPLIPTPGQEMFYLPGLPFLKKS